MYLLKESQATVESIVRRLTPVKMVDQPLDQPGSSTAQTAALLVILVSFASTTQVRMDTVVPPTVSQVPPQVPPVWVPLLQITSVASMAKVAVSLTSQQSGTSAATQIQQHTDAQCRKCDKKIIQPHAVTKR